VIIDYGESEFGSRESCKPGRSPYMNHRSRRWEQRKSADPRVQALPCAVKSGQIILGPKCLNADSDAECPPLAQGRAQTYSDNCDPNHSPLCRKHVPATAIYTGSDMQIPWYIGWPVVAVIGSGILYWAASRAAYYPLKYPRGFWELQSELGAEDVWLSAADGVRLHAWWIAASQAPFVTLYLHGNAGHVTHRFLQIREITAAHSSVLVLDYRGYGRSEDKSRGNIY
jgi:hypothetical protein